MALVSLASSTLVSFSLFGLLPQALGSTTQPTPEEQSRLKEEKEGARKAEPEPGRLSGADLATLIGTDIAFLGLAALAFWLTLFRKVDRKLPALILKKWLILAGIAMLLSGPAVGTARPYLPSSAGLFPWLLLGLMALFVNGWVLIGAALRPRKSYFKGALLGAITYFLIGLGWGNFIIGVEARELMSRNLLDASFIILFWPMHVVYWFELFGLGFN